jgi:hypothetical protein
MIASSTTIYSAQLSLRRWCGSACVKSTATCVTLPRRALRICFVLAGSQSQPPSPLRLFSQPMTSRVARPVTRFSDWRWCSLFLLPDIREDLFENLGHSLIDVQEYASLDGHEKQWQSLFSNNQVASHPVLKKLPRKDSFIV